MRATEYGAGIVTGTDGNNQPIFERHGYNYQQREALEQFQTAMKHGARRHEPLALLYQKKPG
jgi:hypothetical protein